MRGTAAAFNGDGSDDDMPSSLRFARGVGRLVTKRLHLASETMRKDAVAVFLFEPEGFPEEAGSRQPLLGEGQVEVAGCIWFVNETAQSGRPFIPSSTELANISEELEQAGFGRTPAAVFNPTLPTPSLHFFPEGLTTDTSDEINIGIEPVTTEQITTVFDEMCEGHFDTPDGQISGPTSVWAKPEKHWAAKGAEAIMQSHMKTALKFALVGCNIRHEQPTSLGRVDLEVEQRSPADTQAWLKVAEIEVKILRERGATGKSKSDLFNQRWIKRGIRQAAAYRDIQGADNGILCCFDLRAEDRKREYCCVDNLEAANDSDVILYRRYLHNSSESARIEKYG